MAQGDLHSVAFPRLDDEQVAMLAKCGTARSLRDGEPLFRAGDADYKFFVVLRGAVEITEDSSGKEKRVRLHEAHEFGGDVSLVTGRPALVSATARGATQVFEIPRDHLSRVMGEKPALADILLRAFIARRELLVASEFQGLRVLGPRSSRATFQIRDFLARNQVPFTWTDTEANPQMADLLRTFGVTEADTPVVTFGTQTLFRNPTTLALAERVGIKRRLSARVFDLVVVGGGPAGLGAAVYGSSEGLATAVIDSIAPGGQAGTSSKIENYLGFPTGLSGSELANRATLQAQRFGTQFSCPSTVVGLEFESDRSHLVLDDGERITTRSIVIATGASYRRLDLPSRERFDGLGVFYAASRTEAQLCQGSQVIVVGGGNSAGQAAMFLSEQACHVLLVLRGDDLRKGMSDYLAHRIEKSDRIDLLLDTEVTELMGAERLERVRLTNRATAAEQVVETPAVFTFIGAIPATGWLPPEIETDAKGFVKTGRAVSTSPHWTAKREPMILETSRPGVFAAGDVRLGSVKRVASAVGEGAMAVQLVHEWIALSSGRG